MPPPLGVLREDEFVLVRETKPRQLNKLDEDELLALHKRIRRARNKHVKNYRRRAALGVEEQAGRGASRPKNARAAQRAEIFEDALARVSGRLEVLARRSAEELKAARLAAARKGSTGPDAAQPAADSGPGKGQPRAHRKTTGGLKRDASSRSKGARRQAARDSR